MTVKRKLLGLKGEDAACDFLSRKGMEVLDRNWKCGYGEVDIVAREDDALVFCEVKTRKNVTAGMPEEAITIKKQERYYKLAQVYCSRTTFKHASVRFDVITIHVLDKTTATLRYYRSAFGLV